MPTSRTCAQALDLSGARGGQADVCSAITHGCSACPAVRQARPLARGGTVGGGAPRAAGVHPGQPAPRVGDVPTAAMRRPRDPLRSWHGAGHGHHRPATRQHLACVATGVGRRARRPAC
ncbi:MAG: hypothetical protein MZW92_56965 [Comamonadaceae bacterium]|nr:hypothetical protein [Comamonadaceae bacterium]